MSASPEAPGPAGPVRGASITVPPALVAALGAEGEAQVGTWSQAQVEAAGIPVPAGIVEAEGGTTAFARLAPAERARQVADAAEQLVTAGELQAPVPPGGPGMPVPGSPLALVRAAAEDVLFSGDAHAVVGTALPAQHAHFYGVRLPDGGRAVLDVRIDLAASTFDCRLRSPAAYAADVAARFFGGPPAAAGPTAEGPTAEGSGGVFTAVWAEGRTVRSANWVLVRPPGATTGSLAKVSGRRMRRRQTSQVDRTAFAAELQELLAEICAAEPAPRRGR